MDISNIINNTESNQDQQMVQLPASLLSNLLQRLEQLETIISSNPQLLKNKKQQQVDTTNKNNGVPSAAQFSFDLGTLPTRTTVKEHEKRVPLGNTLDSQWADLLKRPFTMTNNNNKNTKNTNQNNTKKQKNKQNLEKTTNKKNKKPENNNKKYFSNTKVGIERAHRAFTEPSTTPSSYEFVHIPCNRRISKQDARALLTQIGVQQSRVIDIQYPARNTVSFFVHSEFAPIFRAALTKHQFKEKENFDLLDVTNIANPQYANLPTAEKKTLAREIYNKRMVQLCAVKLVAKPFLAKSIARFLANTTSDLNIPATEFGDIFKSHTKKPDAPTTITITESKEDDTTMEEQS